MLGRENNAIDGKALHDSEGSSTGSMRQDKNSANV